MLTRRFPEGKGRDQREECLARCGSRSNRGILCTLQSRLSPCLSSKISGLLLTGVSLLFLHFQNESFYYGYPVPDALLYIRHMCMRHIFLFNSLVMKTTVAFKPEGKDCTWTKKLRLWASNSHCMGLWVVSLGERILLFDVWKEEQNRYLETKRMDFVRNLLFIHQIHFSLIPGLKATLQFPSILAVLVSGMWMGDTHTSGPEP